LSKIESIHYSGLILDRASELRKDVAWVSQQWSRSDCRVLLLKNDANLMHWQAERLTAPVSISHNREEIANLSLESSGVVFLGLDQDIPLFAADVSGHKESVFEPVLGENEFIDLRQAGWLLSAQEAALLAYARGLLYWNRHSGFCSTCGSPTEIQHGGHVKLCTNPQCERMTFPRTDPAVIMLVEQWPASGPPLCLLARNARFPTRLMSTLAGFVDPSESLEETVIREVFEESGIHVANVAYQASQPWPFPSSIMLGFRALAVTTEIHIDGIEIEEAGWFSAEQLESFGEWGDAGEGLCLPRRDSIARYLIESWIADVTRHPG
jgi:NAD+ diphosphatase